MNKKVVKNLKLMITLIILFCFVWFLVLGPMFAFRGNEKALENAARRYFELNANELPTGERVKTLSLNTLYHKSFLKEDLRVPITKKNCSIENSWVKVRRENNEYKYYVYLECGLLTSRVDHKGPEIKLNGDSDMIINVGDEYTDPGVQSVVDNVDGKLKTDIVTKKGDVNPSKIGTYEVQYIASDSLSNKTIVTRKVSVVKKLYNHVSKELGDATNYTGYPDSNYIRLSNILFRIYGVDENKNVIVVTDEDISNVNYIKIDSWLDYFYDHLNSTVQNLIVPSKYCNMKVTDETLGSLECTSYSNKKKLTVPSIIEVNKAQGEFGSFMRPYTMSWIANAKDKNTAYVTRNVFYDDYSTIFLPYENDHYYGIRPMMTIKGDILIQGGSGSLEDPYTIGDVKKARGGTHVNERFTGEYLSINSFVYRIVDTQKDGTTRIISEATVGTNEDHVECSASGDKHVITYDPKDITSVAYYINNRVSRYINISLFENHEITVPIYKDKIIYGEEVKTEKYKVKVSAPDMFEMFAAQPQRDSYCGSFWTKNASQGERMIGAIYNIGVPLNQEIPMYMPLGVRVVGYLKKDTVVSSGDGTFESPYVIK